MFDFRIYTFMEVCKTLNYTKAAKNLCITQPAVSKHIQYLQEYFHATLFIYQGKKITLTDEGALLYKAANTMLKDEALLKEQIKENQKKKKKISFGVTLTIGEFVMNKCLQAYLKAHEDIQISMQVNNTKELLEKLDQGEIEFAIIEGSIDHETYQEHLFSMEEFIAVAATDYLFEQKIKKLSDLTKEHLILREPGSGSREIFLQALKERDIPLSYFEKRTEIGSIHLIKEMVEQKAGITFLYETAVREEILQEKFQKIPLEDFLLYHNFSFIWRKSSIYGDEYEAILKEFKQIYQQM